MTLPTIDLNATGDANFAPCRCGLARNEHPESRWYADAEDDPAADVSGDVAAQPDMQFEEARP